MSNSWERVLGSEIGEPEPAKVKFACEFDGTYAQFLAWIEENFKLPERLHLHVTIGQRALMVATTSPTPQKRAFSEEDHFTWLKTNFHSVPYNDLIEFFHSRGGAEVAGQVGVFWPSRLEDFRKNQPTILRHYITIRIVELFLPAVARRALQTGARNKIEAIKEWREATGHGLKQSKDCVEWLLNDSVWLNDFLNDPAAVRSLSS